MPCPRHPRSPSIQDINTDESKTHINTANHLTHLNIGQFQSQYLLPDAYSNPVRLLDIPCLAMCIPLS